MYDCNEIDYEREITSIEKFVDNGINYKKKNKALCLMDVLSKHPLLRPHPY